MVRVKDYSVGYVFDGNLHPAEKGLMAIMTELDGRDIVLGDVAEMYTNVSLKRLSKIGIVLQKKGYLKKVSRSTGHGGISWDWEVYGTIK